MSIYHEKVPEHYYGPDISVTIHYKQRGVAIATELDALIAKFLRMKALFEKERVGNIHKAKEDHKKCYDFW